MMDHQARRRGPGRIRLAVLALAVAGVIAHNVLAAVERRERAPGQFIDVGGHRLHVVASGLDQPGPTVLLECGIGGSTAASWAWERRAIQSFAPVVSYDRAGLGASDPGPTPRDGITLVTELHTALERGGFHPPYVFVGHSYGGLLARLFTDRYPDEVVGAVLVESSYPSPGRTAHALRGFRSLYPAAPWVARLGLMRAYVTFFPIDADRLPDPERHEQRAYLSSSRHWAGIVRELKAWGPLTNPEAARTHGFGSRPLMVLTAQQSAKRWGGWANLQQGNAALSSDAERRIVPGATHGSAVTDSASALVVANAVHDVVRAVRSGRRLHDVAAR
ncbi:MAG TPA: alpha/beta fold hydrolase [Candidatus Udaeobacter sp.]|jgi:pimeloyl-ACP methyl ester carboxylesterase|nr:alpha/beta fold hydrolase [Candidatus Udaeobacter sp.]